MKIQGRAAIGYCEKPDPQHAGFLLHGPDAALTAERRAALVASLSGGDSLRVERADPAAVRKDQALLHDALRTSGFFTERPIVVLEGAGDGLTEAIRVAVDGTTQDDGVLVATAGQLTARSSLRKLFEGDKRLVSLGLYPEPPDGVEIAASLKRAGLAHGVSSEAIGMLEAHAAEVDRGSLNQTIERIALFGLDQKGSIEASAVASLLPATAEAETEKLVFAVIAGRAGEAASRLRRLLSGGTAPVSVLIQVGGLFRQLFGVALERDPMRAVDRMRPRPIGPRRDAILNALRRWDAARLETALSLLQETDRLLRSGGQRPIQAILERCVVRLAIMGSR